MSPSTANVSAMESGTPVPRVRLRKRRLTHLRKVQILAFLCGLPGILATIVMLSLADYPMKIDATILVLAIGAWIAFACLLQQRIVRPLQTASNMLSALREGDFSLLSGYVHDVDPLGQVMLEINRLTQVLSEHRLGAIEALALLNKVVEEIDVGVFTFDEDNRLRLVNQKGLEILGSDAREAIGRTASELGLDQPLECELRESRRVCYIGHREGRYAVRRGVFREGGEPHMLLLLTDVTQNLREEERAAWKRLIRVLGHELNNSMAPITSLSSSLHKIVAQEVFDPDSKEDLREGLEIIRTRADSLSRFMEDYSRLAKLPAPNRQPTSLGRIVEHAARLSKEVSIDIRPGPKIVLPIDSDQIEQLLINVIKNAAEAVLETGGRVGVTWGTDGARATVVVEDEGNGIANPANLFIPFFSTKSGGSGIGLTLSRQIADNHDGHLELVNREDRTGCRATLTLPLNPS